jgi:tetratricopeptide (TPR) repeat protein
MNTRAAVIGGAVLLLLAAGGLGWNFLGPVSSPDPSLAGSAPLPVPPVPPRLVEGARYEQCLAMLPNDPRGAANFAESWSDGGDGAAHCAALAEVALGNVQMGADHLARLAAASQAPAAARAAVYEQAAQAWLMAGRAAQAFDAGTAALALAPDDADLLVDRAVAAAALNRFNEALTDLTHALEIDPNRAELNSGWRRTMSTGPSRSTPRTPRRCWNAASCANAATTRRVRARTGNARSCSLRIHPPPTWPNRTSRCWRRGRNNRRRAR